MVVPADITPRPVYASSEKVHTPVGSRPVAPPPVYDTIAPAQAKPSAPIIIDRPLLPPPDFSGQLPANAKPPTLSELRFLAVMEAFRSFGDEMLSSLGVRLESYRLQLEDISTENLEKLKEASENAKSSDFWSLLTKVATCLLSALSVVIGISLVATGGLTLVGGAMIGSGIFSLANMLMSETKTWDWVAKKLANDDEERQKMLAMLLPAAAGILSGLVGVFGSAGAVVWTGVTFFDKAILIAQTSLAMFNGVTTIGKGYADAKTLWLQADLTKMKSNITIERQMVDRTTKSIEDVLDGLNAAQTKSAQFVRMAIRSNQAVVEYSS